MAIPKRRKTDFIVVHCSATTEKETKVDAAEIDTWHRRRGFIRCGYHFVIKRDGVCESAFTGARTREVDEIGAHVEGYNASSIGICMVGGVDSKTKLPTNNFTPAQWETLKTLLTSLKRNYPQAEILGHRDFPKVKKECPCFDVREWVSVNLKGETDGNSEHGQAQT